MLLPLKTMLKNIKTATKLTDLNPDQVKELQELLVKLKYSLGAVDGIFGNNTHFAYKRFKQDYKLTNPDEFGPTTFGVIVAATTKSLDNVEADKIVSPQPVFSNPQVVPNRIDWNDFDCPISKYFTVGEVSKFSKDRIVRINSHQANAIALAKLLDQIRIEWGGALGVTSWYRPYAVNRAVKGASNSQHLTASGVDIYPIGADGRKFEKWLDARWDRALGYGQRSGKGFSHIDLRSIPKRTRWYY